ncbi:cysteine-rich receptor-like protein kinase 3 isoform X1 [Nymphaea colorata]|uniref:cysteine-rich receptor-like protein kinase 3 isoform X1 n=1 Tax=Nymphaea colorata TaxID=210225 RepID=UPI00214E9608|nr:cysteine-rich receptor-like protein kinase 3 isoform X1 [Nymphaea colorata]
MSYRAVSNNGFWRGSVGSGNSTVYAIGQCWETLNMSSCKTCLDTAASKIDSCLPSFQARVLSSGCYLRYADYQFYDSSTASTSSGGCYSNLGLGDGHFWSGPSWMSQEFNLIYQFGFIRFVLAL